MAEVAAAVTNLYFISHLQDPLVGGWAGSWHGL